MRYKCAWGLLFVAAFLAACGGGHESPTAPLSGAGYLLSTVNGRGLPADVVNLGGFPARRYYERLDLSDDGTYVREQRDSTPQPTGVIATGSTFDYGTWTRRGDSVFLASTLSAAVAKYPPGRGIATATAASIAFGAATFAYARRP